MTLRSRMVDQWLADPFEVSGSAGRVRGWVCGPPRPRGAPVLLVHPVNLRGECWREVAERLPDHRCVMPDLRGHGSSDPSGPFGLADWRDDLWAVMDGLRLERAHVVGGSLGGPLAIALAAGRPDRVLSLTAVCSALRIEGEGVDTVLGLIRREGVAGMFAEAIPEMSVAPGTARETVERVLALCNPNDADTVAAIWGATLAADAAPLAARVRCPSLVLAGGHDRTCSIEQGRALARSLDARLEVLPDVGHLPMLEAPAPLAARLATWLETWPEGRAEAAGR